MHRYAILFGVLFVFFSCKKKTVEVLVQDFSIATDASLNQIKFVGTHAIIVGGVLYHRSSIYMLSTQNEISAIPIPPESTQKEIFALDISPSGKLMAVGYDASVYMSSDSGNHWNFVQNGSWKIFRDIAFRDIDTAFVASARGFNVGGVSVLDANGNGSNQLREERNFGIEDIDFINQNTGYLCGYGVVMKTVDGGHTWNFTSAKNDYFKSMCWKSEQEGVVVGYAGSILKTLDGGQSWQTIRNGNSITKKKIHYLAVECNDKGTCIAVGERGHVSLSYDFGSNWQEAKKFAEKDLKGLAFKGESECVVVGAHGAVYLIKL